MKRVVIIGAGPAGLTAAKELLAGNEPYDITILEESRDRRYLAHRALRRGQPYGYWRAPLFSKSDEIMQRWAQDGALAGRAQF